MPPMVASHTMEVSESRQCCHRSSGVSSTSATARITERMSKGCLRSGLASNTSPTTRNGVYDTSACGEVRTSRSTMSVVGRRRGNRSPGTTYV